MGFVVADLQAGLDAVDWYAARGYSAVKLYNSIQPDWVQPLAARAHALGLRVTGHVPAFMRAEEVVRAGYDELTHINQVMLNFLVRPGDDTRTLMRFERVGADAQALDLKSSKARAFIKLLKDRGTVVDATAMTFEAMFTQTQGQANPATAEVADHLPALWRRGLRVAEMDLDAAKLKAYRASYQRMLQMIAALHRAGVPLVAGTDGLAGLGLHRELALYVQAGIPASEVLRIATLNGARIAGQGATRGRIERGYEADLLLVDGDPTQDIAALRKASLVIQGRVAYSPERIYQAIGFKPFVAGAEMQAPQQR
jgi:imidazolonepropionase-like amidohydrolase